MHCLPSSRGDCLGGGLWWRSIPINPDGAMLTGGIPIILMGSPEGGPIEDGKPGGGPEIQYFHECFD